MRQLHLESLLLDPWLGLLVVFRQWLRLRCRLLGQLLRKVRQCGFEISGDAREGEDTHDFGWARRRVSDENPTVTLDGQVSAASVASLPTSWEMQRPSSLGIGKW